MLVGWKGNFSGRKKLGNYGRRPAQDINTLRANFRPSALPVEASARFWKKKKPYSVRTPGVFHGHITCSYCTHTGVYGMLGTVFPSGFTSHFVSYTTYNTEDIQPPYWQLLAIWLLVGFVRVLIGGWSTMRWSCYLFHQYRWSKRRP